MQRHIPLPSFLSTKRSKAITIAAAGTLTLAAVVSTAAVTLSSPPSPPAASADAALMNAMSQQAAAQSAQHATTSGVQETALFDKARLIQGEREAQQAAAAKAAAARAAAAHKAAAAKAAAASAAAAKATAQAKTAQAKTAQAKTAQQAAAATPSGSPEQIAEQMLSQYGWSQSQFSCLQPLWEHESGWSVSAENPSSGAYGIPQALPGSQMSSAGADWQTNAATQIKWGLSYIHDRYGSPCGAWDHEEADGWY